MPSASRIAMYSEPSISPVARMATMPVLEPRGHAGLALEPDAELLVGRQPGRDHLQRDGPVEGLLPGPVHHPHATLAEQTVDAVTAETASRREVGHVPAGHFLRSLNGQRTVPVDGRVTGAATAAGVADLILTGVAFFGIVSVRARVASR